MSLSLPFIWLVFAMRMLSAPSGVIGPLKILQPNPQQIDEKRTRTPAQQKIDSRLLNAMRLKRQGLAITDSEIVNDSKGRVTVDISGEVTDKLLSTIRSEGGEVVNSYPQFKSVRAYLGLATLETVAALPEVRMISNVAKPELNVTTRTTDIIPDSQDPSLVKPRNVGKGAAIRKHRRRRKRRSPAY
jgi:hypothetical protein